MANRQSIGPRLRKQWRFLSTKPLGKWLFSQLVGYIAPYSGSIPAIVRVLQPGQGVVTLKDCRRVRNHLGSVHAIALANLGELVTGLTLMNSLPENMRGILTGLRMQYHKKARGNLKAQCRCQIPQFDSEQEMVITGEIKNAEGELVATTMATWLIGPEKE